MRMWLKGVPQIQRLFSRSFWNGLGLSTRMSIIALVGLPALIGIFGFLSVTATRESTAKALQERVILAQLAASHTDYVLDNVETRLRARASQETLRRLSQLSTLTDQERQAIVNRSDSPFLQLILTDVSGNVFAADPPLPAELVAAFPIARVLHQDSFNVGGANLPGLGPAVVAALPIQNDAGRNIGALVGTIELSALGINPAIEAVTLGQTGYLEIIDANGLILLSTQPQRLLTQADHRENLMSMIRTGKSTVTTCHNCHSSQFAPERESEVIAFAPLRRASWGVVIRQSEAEAFTASRQLTGQIAFFGAIAVVGALALVWITTRWVIAPVQDLRLAAERIATGDLQTPISAQRGDEIGALADTFDAMRARLRTSINEIQTLNRDLDLRVQERTREYLNAQVELRQSRDYLQSIIDGLDDVLLVVGPDRVVRQANRAATKEFDQRQIVGLTCHQVSRCPSDCESESGDCPLPTVFSTGQVVRLTHTAMNGNQPPHFVDIVASPLRNAEGKVEAVIELKRDVTEEYRLRETLVERNRHLSALNSVTQTTTHQFQLGDFLDKTLAEVLHVTQVDVGAIFLLSEERDALELQNCRGTTEQVALEMTNVHVDDSACGGVLEKGRPVVVQDLTCYRSGAGRSLFQAGLRSLVHIPLISRGIAQGTMCIGTQAPREFSTEEIDLLMAIGNQVAIGIENAQLYAELARREQLRGELLEKVITAQEEERKRIARDLHDDTSQSISALIYALEATEATCHDAKVRATLTAIRQRATQTIEGIHKLIFDLRPSMLDHLGLFVASRWYAETNLQPRGIRVHLEERGVLRRLPPNIETALFRVVQETINNIIKHSGARNVRMLFDCPNGVVYLSIADDGIGFVPGEVARSIDQKRGLGLVGMQERINLLGGKLEIVSEPGVGTQVSINVPVEHYR